MKPTLKAALLAALLAALVCPALIWFGQGTQASPFASMVLFWWCYATLYALCYPFALIFFQALNHEKRNQPA